MVTADSVSAASTRALPASRLRSCTAVMSVAAPKESSLSSAEETAILPPEKMSIESVASMSAWS